MNTPDPIASILARQKAVILDGALATELERRGADLRGDLWSAKILLENPEMIRTLHHDYFVAGADVAITASYQASFEGFQRRGLDRKQAADLMQASVFLACQARDAFWNKREDTHRVRPLVAASIGCYGAYLANGAEYTGDYDLTKQELIDWHRPRLETLLAAEPDLLACETIPLLAEGEALVDLLADYPEARAWLSFSCCDESHVCHGEPFTDAVALANSSAQIVAVGLNCTAPRRVLPLLQQASETTNKPLVVYPNSGEQWDNSTMCWIEDTGVTDFAAPAAFWYDGGARLLGGCCRTTPSDISMIRRTVLA